MDRLMDTLVAAVAPDPKHSDSLSSVKIELICAVSAPMIFMTNFQDINQVRITSMLLLNIFVRLLYPSCYFPASGRVAGVVGHPLTARLIAFVAEFGLYETWATWVGQKFWGEDTYLWLVVLIGECISTLALVIQSEMLFNVEDTTWTIHTAYMCVLSVHHLPHRPTPALFFGGFAIHMIFNHLPRRFALLYSRGMKPGESVWSMDPLFGLSCGRKNRQNKVLIQPCDVEELAWVVPMLLLQPILTALMYFVINTQEV
jgi:hypothetical protein